jgi:hypothetical protein
MGTTGAPWNIPYVDPSDNVRNFPTDDEAKALAIAAGLSSAAILVSVKSQLFTGTRSDSTAAGAITQITQLDIAHSVADAANKVVLIANISGATQTFLRNAIVLTVDGTATAVGDTAGSRRRVSAENGNASADQISTTPMTIVFTPGDTASRTYGAAVMNVSTSTLTCHVNRSVTDTDNGAFSRAVSTLTLLEVRP